MDTSGPALKQTGLDIYLLKPSLSELMDLTGRKIRDGIRWPRCCAALKPGHDLCAHYLAME